MSETNLEQLIAAARALPLEERRRLREWLQEQETSEQATAPRQEAVRQQIAKFQQAMHWIEQHRAQYLGQWVVLDGDRLITHGLDGKQVYEQAKAAGIAVPFIEHVTEEEKSPFCGGWLP